MGYSGGGYRIDAARDQPMRDDSASDAPTAEDGGSDTTQFLMELREDSGDTSAWSDAERYDVAPSPAILGAHAA